MSSSCYAMPLTPYTFTLKRNNIGNARIAGLEKDLHLKGFDFNVVLSIFCKPANMVRPPLTRSSQS